MEKTCSAHSGVEVKLENIEGLAKESKIIALSTCKKVDTLKLLVISLMGGVIVQLIFLIANGGH